MGRGVAVGGAVGVGAGEAITMGIGAGRVTTKNATTPTINRHKDSKTKMLTIGAESRFIANVTGRCG